MTHSLRYAAPQRSERKRDRRATSALRVEFASLSSVSEGAPKATLAACARIASRLYWDLTCALQLHRPLQLYSCEVSCNNISLSPRRELTRRCRPMEYLQYYAAVVSRQAGNPQSHHVHSYIKDDEAARSDDLNVQCHRLFGIGSSAAMCLHPYKGSHRHRSGSAHESSQDKRTSGTCWRILPRFG